MEDLEAAKEKVLNDGFAVVENVFSAKEVDEILRTLSGVDAQAANIRQAAGLYAVRQVLKEVPGLKRLLFTPKLSNPIPALFGRGFFVVKSIYFDKPAQSNWFVPYHQDLSISVDKKIEAGGFTHWTVKPNDFAAQPPLAVLEDNFTLRIHLDDTDEANGALKVIPGSHRNGIIRAGAVDWAKETAVVCGVKKGGVMAMKPLLLHASGRTTNDKSRRVIHLEFSRSSLPQGLQWAEFWRP